MTMTPLRTLLVDDEPLALRGLRVRLEAIDGIEIVGESRNGREAIQAIRDLQPDLVFLDIQMPGLNGFAVVKSLVGSHMPLIVFVTAFDEYALEAFDAHALDYILKPPEESRLKEAIQRARKRMTERTAIQQNAKIVELLEKMEDPPKVLLSAVLEDEAASPERRYDRQIHIRDRGYITRVPIEEIDFIEAAGDYMCIYTPEKTHILRATMKTLERRLDPAVFQRVHRSTIVNLNRVKKLIPHSNGEYFLVLENGKELKLSRTYRDIIGRFV